jgi:hypothetical protein
MFEGVNRVRHERTEELAREVLHDLKCLEHTHYQCCWLGPSPQAHRDTHVPALILRFEHPDIGVCPAMYIQFINNGFANGSPLHDAKIKAIIRTKVEKYLRMISEESGINTPWDMRLSEEKYA